jgi:hypothetical protein
LFYQSLLYAYGSTIYGLNFRQKSAETDPNDFLAGLNWKEFANYEAQNQQVDSNDVVVLPQPCRNQQEIADQLRVLVEQQAQRFVSSFYLVIHIIIVSFRSANQEDGEELDDEIVCLGEVRGNRFVLVFIIHI